jgi:hypothetical protein
MFKNISLAVAIILVNSIAFSQNSTIQVNVDERIELMSVVCRLADYEEFCQDLDYNKSPMGSAEYNKDVKDRFTPFKSDSLIQFTIDLRKNRGMGYDAPMKFGICLQIENDRLQFIPNLKHGVDAYDERWTKEDARKFLVLLNKFYAKTGFHDFFEQHRPIYNTMEVNFTKCMDNFNLQWFDKFFGIKSDATFSIVLSCLNGGGNYGPGNVFADNSQHIYSILGPWIFDSTMAVNQNYISNIRETTIHEFCHTYCNPLIDQSFEEMKKNSSKMHKYVETEMVNQAYPDSKTMMYELLVRSCVIKNLSEDTTSSNLYIQKMIEVEKINGFLWVDTVYAALNQYDNLRLKYPSLDSYMPELVKLLNSLSPKECVRAYEQACPELAIHTSIPNGEKNVDPEMRELVVSFDRIMKTGTNGCTYGKEGEKYFPRILGAHWDNNGRDWVLEIKLEPEHEYSIVFPYQWFRDESGNPGRKGSYNLKFKTGKSNIGQQS